MSSANIENNALWGETAWTKAFAVAQEEEGGRTPSCQVVVPSTSGSQDRTTGRNGVHVKALTALSVGATIIKEVASVMVPPFTPDASSTASLEVQMRLHTLNSLLGHRKKEAGGGGLASSSGSQAQEPLVHAMIEDLCQPEFAGGEIEQRDVVTQAVESYTENNKSNNCTPSPTPSTSVEQQLLLALDCNAHALSHPEVASRVVFPTICKLNHSCAANCALETTIEEKDGGRFTVTGVVRVIKPVHAGDEMTVNYLPSHYQIASTQQRRSHLLKAKYFVCQCTVCGTAGDVDPKAQRVGPTTEKTTVAEASHIEQDTMSLINNIFTGSGGGVKTESEAAATRQDLEKLWGKAATMLGSSHWCTSSLGMLAAGMDAQMLVNLPVVEEEVAEAAPTATSAVENQQGSGVSQATWMMALGDCVKQFLESYRWCVKNSNSSSSGSGCEAPDMGEVSHEVLVATTSNLLVVCDAVTLIPERIESSASATTEELSTESRSWRQAHSLIVSVLIQVLSVHLLATLKAFGPGAKNVHAILGVWSKMTSSFKPSSLSWVKATAAGTKAAPDSSFLLLLGELEAVVKDLVFDDFVIEVKGVLIPSALHSLILQQSSDGGNGDSAAAAAKHLSTSVSTSVFSLMSLGVYGKQLVGRITDGYSSEEGETEFRLDRLRCHTLLPLMAVGGSSQGEINAAAPKAAEMVVPLSLLAALGRRMEPVFLNKIGSGGPDTETLTKELVIFATARATYATTERRVAVAYLKGLVMSCTDLAEVCENSVGEAALKLAASKVRAILKGLRPESLLKSFKKKE